MLQVVGNDLQNQRVLSDGFRVGGTGSFRPRKFLYSFVPLRMFTALINLNLSSTAISNHHLQQIIRVASNLDRLYIFNCPDLDQSCIFQIKQDLNQLRHVNISGNPQLTILVVACLYSCKNLQIIVTYGLKFSPEELLFLTKTFDSVSNGTLEIETEDGYDAANAMNMFAEEVRMNCCFSFFYFRFTWFSFPFL